MKILLSHLCYRNDFTDNQINEAGPNHLFHQNFFKLGQYDKHLLVSWQGADCPYMAAFIKKLSISFPKHEVEAVFLDIKEPSDLAEVQNKTFELLNSFPEKTYVDIFFNPGYQLMQLALLTAHWSLSASTNILQMKRTKAEQYGLELVQVNIGHADVASFMHFQKQKPRFDLNLSAFWENLFSNPLITNVYKSVDRVAFFSNLPLWIAGDAATGKTTLAQYVHLQTHKQLEKADFHVIDCEFTQPQVLESVLFKNNQSRKALLDHPTPLTILFKNTTFMAKNIQVALFRVIEEQLAGKETQSAHVRLLFSDKQTLASAVAQEKLFTPLADFLAPFEFILPSFLNFSFSDKTRAFELINQRVRKLFPGKSLPLITKDAKAAFCQAPLKGNFRQVQNALLSLYARAADREPIDVVHVQKVLNLDPDVSPEKVLPEHLSKHTAVNVSEPANWDFSLVEKEHLRRALIAHKGNLSKTCKAVGYGSLNTLKEKMKRYGLLKDK